MWATYGVFTKKFTDYDEVTVKASRIGLQLPQRADVKIKGVIVGEVLDYEPTAEGADITLGLYQDRTTDVPRDVTASILPKTLFGEKFVSLVVPDGGSSAQPIADGDVIQRTDLSIEVEQVLSDLYPLLRAVQPADLNTTLNAVATALEGRGEQLGETPRDARRLPDPLQPRAPRPHRGPAAHRARSPTPTPTCCRRSPRSCATRSPPPSTLEDREDKLKALFNDVSKLATVAERFTRANGDNLVRLARPRRGAARGVRALRPRLPLPARRHRRGGQAPGRGVPRLHPAHRAGDAAQPAARLRPAGRPGLRRQARLPLRHAAHPAVVPEQPAHPQPDFVDGVDEPTGKGTSRVGPGWSGTAAGFAGGRDESALLKALLAPGLGVSADDVPDLGVLLVGPMARGAEVSLR